MDQPHVSSEVLMWSLISDTIIYIEGCTVVPHRVLLHNSVSQQRVTIVISCWLVSTCRLHYTNMHVYSKNSWRVHKKCYLISHTEYTSTNWYKVVYSKWHIRTQSSKSIWLALYITSLYISLYSFVRKYIWLFSFITRFILNWVIIVLCLNDADVWIINL